MADEPAGVTVLHQPGVRVGRGHLLPAGAADGDGGVAAAVEEQEHLLAAHEGRRHGVGQGRGEPAAAVGGVLAQVDEADVGQARGPVARGQAQPAVAARLRVHQRLEARRRRGQHHGAALDGGAGHRQVAGVVDEALVLLERAVVLLVDDHQRQVGEGEEQRGARAHHDPRPAGDHRLPHPPPGGGRDPRVPLGRRRAEPRLHARQQRLGERDLRQQQQHLRRRPGAQGGGHRLQVHLGLAGARHPVEQRRLVAARAHHVRQGDGGGRLGGVQLRSGPVGVGRGEGGFGPVLLDGEDALVHQPLNHGGAHARRARELGGGGGPLPARRGDHALARRRRTGGRASGGDQAAERAGRRRAQAPQRQRQRLARRLAGVARRPEREAQRALRQGRIVERTGKRLQRPVQPRRIEHLRHHAADEPRAERRGDVIAHRRLPALRHGVVERLGQRQRQQDARDAGHGAHIAAPRRRR